MRSLAAQVTHVAAAAAASRGGRLGGVASWGGGRAARGSNIVNLVSMKSLVSDLPPWLVEATVRADDMNEQQWAQAVSSWVECCVLHVTTCLRFAIFMEAEIATGEVASVRGKLCNFTADGKKNYYSGIDEKNDRPFKQHIADAEKDYSGTDDECYRYSTWHSHAQGIRTRSASPGPLDTDLLGVAGRIFRLGLQAPCSRRILAPPASVQLSTLPDGSVASHSLK